MMRLAALLLVPALVLVAGDSQPKKKFRRGGIVTSATEAKAIAESETGGQAVDARRIHLNGASGGWEVEVHMPREDRGWRCVIDADTRSVHSKERIPNPKLSRKRR